jgi:hypothetical protein
MSYACRLRLTAVGVAAVAALTLQGCSGQRTGSTPTVAGTQTPAASATPVPSLSALGGPAPLGTMQTVKQDGVVIAQLTVASPVIHTAPPPGPASDNYKSPTHGEFLFLTVRGRAPVSAPATFVDPQPAEPPDAWVFNADNFTIILPDGTEYGSIADQPGYTGWPVEDGVTHAVGVRPGQPFQVELDFDIPKIQNWVINYSGPSNEILDWTPHPQATPAPTLPDCSACYITPDDPDLQADMSGATVTMTLHGHQVAALTLVSATCSDSSAVAHFQVRANAPFSFSGSFIGDEDVSGGDGEPSEQNEPYRVGAGSTLTVTLHYPDAACPGGLKVGGNVQSTTNLTWPVPYPAN